MDTQAKKEGLPRADEPPITRNQPQGEKLGAAPVLHPDGAAPGADHPAEIVLRFCADWKYAVRLVHDELLVSPEGAPSAEAKLAAELLPTIFYSAAVMDEDTRRVRRWLHEIDRAKTIAELDSIMRWRKHGPGIELLTRFAECDERQREEVVRVAEGYLRRSVNPLAQAIAPAVFTPEGVRRTRDLLAERVFGQERAIEAVVGRVEIAAAGLADEDKPLGSFFFLGPTGVGKTEVARVLAESLPDGASALAIYDMGQYKHEGDLTKLVGWTIGGRDSERDGAMVAHVRKHPYSVLVFDEIEKADPEIHDLFLGILDDARVQDQYGRNVSLADTIVIFTSNLQGDELSRAFRREFLNRIDETIEFDPLTSETLVRIFDKLFGEARVKYFRRRRVHVEVTPKARDHLIRLSGEDHSRNRKAPVGFGRTESQDGAGSREMGARSLARVLDRTIERWLAAAINRGEVGSGDRVVVDTSSVENGPLTFARVPVADATVAK